MQVQMQMQIRLRFFASLREALGPGETLAVATGTTVAMLRATLVARGGEYARLLAPGRALRAAVNHDMADDSQVLNDDAEVAFFPPVTGG